VDVTCYQLEMILKLKFLFGLLSCVLELFVAGRLAYLSTRVYAEEG
jgi:hypothetical protein